MLPGGSLSKAEKKSQGCVECQVKTEPKSEQKTQAQVFTGSAVCGTVAGKQSGRGGSGCPHLSAGPAELQAAGKKAVGEPAHAALYPAPAWGPQGTCRSVPCGLALRL